MEISESAVMNGRILSVDLWYPRNGGKPDTVEIGLCDVRAAPSIRIAFDFERNGYTVAKLPPDAEADGEWVEVAFIPAS